MPAVGDSMSNRDFLGYGAHPPDPRWPGGARVAVSFVLNVEEGAELSLSDGDERNEGTYEVRDEIASVPDRCWNLILSTERALHIGGS